MPTTSNFGWTTPADTDLVKDGAAAIRTLGNGIDTSLLDLKGGTTGQILSKASNTDLDYTWIANDQGDITAVSAGTGISVASGTGPIPVVTNTMATEITAKGDLIVGTGSGTFDNLPAGTNGHILVADSSVSPTGLKWAAPSAASYVGVSVYKSANQSIANNTDTALTFDSEFFNTGSFHSTSTNNSRLTIPSGKGGKYLLSGAVSWGAAGGTIRVIKIYKNGSVLNQISQIDGTNDGSINPAANVYELVATDYLEVYVRQNSGGNLDVQSGTLQTTIQLSYLGA
jgi:hypothetical protein